MAKARMISNGIAQDKRVHQLSDDISRLAYTWLITFADCEGRTPGDPAIVRAMLFPRREDITIAQMEGQGGARQGMARRGKARRGGAR